MAQPHNLTSPTDPPSSEPTLLGPDQSAQYESVRDSWVESPPQQSDVLRGDPPALPASIRETPAERSPADDAFVDRVLERLSVGDYAGALLAAEALLRRLPRDPDVLDSAEMSRVELRKIYKSRLGDLDQVPTVAMTPAALTGVTLDVYAGFLLSRIDGLTTLREITLTPGVSPDHALRVLSELYLQGVIALDR
jgi:hypothetical protein